MICRGPGCLAAWGNGVIATSYMDNWYLGGLCSIETSRCPMSLAQIGHIKQLGAGTGSLLATIIHQTNYNDDDEDALWTRLNSGSSAKKICSLNRKGPLYIIWCWFLNDIFKFHEHEMHFILQKFIHFILLYEYWSEKYINYF